MTDNVKGFIVLKEFKAGIRLLNTQQKGELFEALLCDMGGEDLPELDPVTNAVFTMMLPSVRAAQNRYEEKRNALSEAGKRGGRPRKAEREEEPEEEAEKSERVDNGKKPPFSEKATLFEKSQAFSEKPPFLEKSLPLGEKQNRIEENRIEENLKRNQKEKVGATAPRASERPTAPSERYPDAFLAFWQLYPRKTGKDAAFKAWTVLKREKRLPEQSVLEAAIREAMRTEQWQTDGGRFIPHPATWLNQGRWQDEAFAAPEDTFQPMPF